MYSADLLTTRIKTQAKIKGIKLKTMLEDLDLNINTLNQISDKKGLSCFPLARIADYLDCSVDYLLGKSDVPSSFYKETELSPLDHQLMNLLSQLNDEQKLSVFRLIQSLTSDGK